jgi:hypothetical protein
LRFGSPAGILRRIEKVGRRMTNYRSIVRDIKGPRAPIFPAFHHLYEDEWVARATVAEMTDYIALAVALLRRDVRRPLGAGTAAGTNRDALRRRADLGDVQRTGGTGRRGRRGMTICGLSVSLPSRKERLSVIGDR